MDRFTRQPNSDAFHTEDRVELGGLFDIETWEHTDNGERVWVLVIRDGERLIDHTAIHDRLAAHLIKSQ